MVIQNAMNTVISDLGGVYANRNTIIVHAPENSTTLMLK